MEFQHYFFWSSTSLVIFYLFYLLLLKRETFFILNRVYLLTALCLSILIPFLDLSALIEIPRIEFVISTLSIVGSEKIKPVAEKDLNWLLIVYWIGAAFNSVLLFAKLVGVKRQMKLPIAGEAFSFWRTKVIDKKLSGLEIIDAHENIHIKQLHTLDILLVEIIGIFFWFNPIVYGYRRSLKFIHEYLADAHAANFTESKKQYAMVLFLQNFKTGHELANTFYNVSLLEARIKMLQRKRSDKYRIWKYSFCMPLIAALILMSSFKASDLSSNYSLNKAASFPGGFEHFSNYLIKAARKVSSKSGTVKVSFTVETSGKITNEKIEIGLDEASNTEALRLIKSSQKWNPAIQNGEKVRSDYAININFRTDNQLIKNHN